MASVNAVRAAMTMLARVFAGDITVEKVAMYAAALDDLTDAQVAASVAVLVKTHAGQFLPVPAQIRDACGANAVASVNVEEVLRAIEQAGSYNAHTGWSWPRVELVRERFGAVVAAAYGAVGGGSRLGSDNDTTREIAQRDFGQALRDAPTPLPALPAPAPLRLPAVLESQRIVAGQPQRLGAMMAPVEGFDAV